MSGNGSGIVEDGDGAGVCGRVMDEWRGFVMKNDGWTVEARDGWWRMDEGRWGSLGSLGRMGDLLDKC
ncbi:hypothetical protein M758_1G185700 [Ceratodon purpureus]|nr:hypothetical protein M758_1G185700 [Ceratodon purpureus]